MKKEHVTLTKKDRTYLENLIKTGEIKVSKYKRAQGLLELDKGRTYKQTAELVGVVPQTVSIWATKYERNGLEFLDDKERSGTPRKIDGIERAKITTLACSDPPEGYSRWTLRLLADRAVELEYIESISHVEVRRILKKTNLSLTCKNSG